MNSHAISVITALAVQQKRPWRTSIFIDGQFWRAYDTETIEHLGLFEGQKITSDDLAQLVFDLEKRRAFNRAVNLLSYRSRSSSEIEERLLKAGFEQEITTAAIDDLKRLGLINDTAFAENWTKNRSQISHFGNRRIKMELKQKGVSDSVITDAIEEVISSEKEFAIAFEVAEKKYRSYKDVDKRAAYRRLSQFLIYRGFDSNIVYDVCKKVIVDV